MIVVELIGATNSISIHQSVIPRITTGFRVILHTGCSLVDHQILFVCVFNFRISERDSWQLFGVLGGD